MAKYRWIIVLALATIFVSEKAYGQQSPIYSQYMFNNFLINPATAGADGYSTIGISARKQWLNFPNAPQTYALSANGRILKRGWMPQGAKKKSKYSRKPSGRVGVGGYLYKDQTGLISRTGAQGTYAYHLFIKNKTQLSFGLSLSAYQFKINRNDLALKDLSDPVIDASNLNILVPDAQFGIALMKQGFYIGLSATDLFQSTIHFAAKTETNTTAARLKTVRNYNLATSYLIEVTREYAVEPSAWLKVTETFNKQLDLSVKMYYTEDYWAGISYRTGSYQKGEIRDAGALVLFGGVRYQRMFFGLAIDYTLNGIRKNTYGTYEFMMAVKLGDKARRYRWVSRY